MLALSTAWTKAGAGSKLKLIVRFETALMICRHTELISLLVVTIYYFMDNYYLLYRCHRTLFYSDRLARQRIYYECCRRQ